MLDYHPGRAFGFLGAGFGIELFVSLVKWEEATLRKGWVMGRRRLRLIGAAAKRGANDDGEGSVKEALLFVFGFPVASV